MATSGTYVFNPTVAELIDEAFERCGIAPNVITFQHIIAARRSLNFLMTGPMINLSVNRWQVETVQKVLAQGEMSFQLPVGTLDILSAVVVRSGQATEMDPIAISAYQAIPDKTIQGRPTSYAVDRAITPTVFIWQPSELSTDVFTYRRLRQVQDYSGLSNTGDHPSRFQDAVAAGLAYKLAQKYSPDRFDSLKREFNEAMGLAKLEDRERGVLSIQPWSC